VGVSVKVRSTDGVSVSPVSSVAVGVAVSVGLVGVVGVYVGGGVSVAVGSVVGAWVGLSGVGVSVRISCAYTETPGTLRTRPRIIDVRRINEGRRSFLI
jgi:hypothetical protein